MQHSRLEFYRLQSDRVTQTLAVTKRFLLVAAMCRLASFVLIMLSCYYLFNGHKSWGYVLGAACMLFIISLRYFYGLQSKKHLEEKLLFINSNEKNVLLGKRNAFSDGEHLAHPAIYATDLDLAGDRSLFHFINRTVTSEGELALAGLLNRPFTTGNAIVEQQAAIKTLSEQYHVRQMITARALLNEKEKGGIRGIAEWMETESRLYGKKWLNVVRYALAVLTAGCLLFALDTGQKGPLAACIMANWLVVSRYGKYIVRQHGLLGRKQHLLDQYASILNEFYRCEPRSSSVLTRLHEQAKNGSREIRRLSVLTSFFDQGSNLLVNLILNSLGMYNIHCMIALEKWKAANRSRFNDWIGATAEIETLNSLATVAYNHPHWCFPEPEDRLPFIAAQQLAHPLISEEESVANDLAAGNDEKLILVSGSNMSGKSTFLRAVAVNLLLAECGAPVCAQRFRFSPMQILSSVRINDSLQEHTSYFMAELKRLQRIIEALETGAPALVLIDEVLRGTNSDDKTYGSEALIRRLVRHSSLTIFATHDLSLSRLEQEMPGVVSNFCFESSIQDGELLFDYKLRKGVAKNRNATFLMQKMGIIAS